MPLEENTFTVLRCPAVTISLHWSFRFILIYSYMSLVTSRTVSPKFLSIFSFVFFSLCVKNSECVSLRLSLMCKCDVHFVVTLMPRTLYPSFTLSCRSLPLKQVFLIKCTKRLGWFLCHNTNRPWIPTPFSAVHTVYLKKTHIKGTNVTEFDPNPFKGTSPGLS